MTLVVAAGFVVSAAGSALAAGRSPQGTSSREARSEAINSIPLEKLSAKDKELVTAAISGRSLFRRLPIQVVPCDPSLYLFMVRHPEVVVGIWEVMNISNVALERTGPDSFRASDGAGTLCQVKYCYSDHETQVIYAEGSYEGPLFSRPVRAACVLVLKSGYVRETDGNYYVTSRMDTFIQIEHAGVELLAKTFQPLVHRSADYNFVETAAFLSTVSRAAETNSAGVSRLAQRLSGVDPKVRDSFATIALEIGRRAQSDDAAQASAVAPVAPAQKRRLAERR